MSNKTFNLINLYEADFICNAINTYTNRHINQLKNIRSTTNYRYFPEESLKKYVIIINEYINNNFIENEISKNIYKLITDTLDSIRIKDEDLYWIELKNKRLCNWIWHSFIEGNVFSRRSRELSFSSSAMTFKEKHSDIIKFFITSNCDKNTKLRLLDDLKILWSEISIDNKIEKVLEESNNKQCIWAYNYILKKFSGQKNKEDEFDFIELNREENISKKFKINDNSDYYFNVMTFFDLIIDPIEKFYKVDCFKKALNQKKHRESNNGKKPYSFNMSVSIGEQLTIMSERFNINRNILVEQLIEKKYKEFIKDLTD